MAQIIGMEEKFSEFSIPSVTSRNVHEVLRTLGAMQTGELCSVNWQRGQETV